jgi:Leucine-rich repeat (LRR) protein
VPAGLAGCFQLLYLQLGGNQLSGALRPELDALASLKVLDLSNNKISGEIPLPLAGCRSLEVVDLSGNEISGELSSAVAKWLSLKFLALAGNQLSGHLPDWMFSFPLLQWLDLSSNKFVGFIPDGGFNVTEVLNGGGGQAQAQATPSESVLPPQLSVSASVNTESWQLDLRYDLQATTGIDLSGNELRGEIPEGLVAMKGLEYLNLSCNYLAGQIPAGLGGMGRLHTLDFSHNGLSGEVPPGIAAMAELEVLNLSYNSLSGPLPTMKFPGALAGNPGICSGEGCSENARTREGKMEGSNRRGWLGGWHGENGWVSLGAFCISTMTSFYVSLATLLCSSKARNFVFRPVRVEY